MCVSLQPDDLCLLCRREALSGFQNSNKERSTSPVLVCASLGGLPTAQCCEGEGEVQQASMLQSLWLAVLPVLAC